MKHHYVDNKAFLAAICEHNENVRIAVEAGNQPPTVPDYVGECIMMIARNLSYRPNFINYTYRDDMILDGIENCIRYLHNFDPEKSKNPFSYFTQIIFYAFLRRIAIEKKQSHIKNKVIQEMSFDTFEVQGQDKESQYVNQYVDYVRSIQTDDDFPKLKPKSETRGTKSDTVLLDDFFEGDVDE